MCLDIFTLTSINFDKLKQKKDYCNLGNREYMGSTDSYSQLMCNLRGEYIHIQHICSSDFIYSKILPLEVEQAAGLNY